MLYTIVGYLINEYICVVSNVAYQFVCRVVIAIRKTRSTAQNHSFRNKDDNIALSVHVKSCECESIEDFVVNILACGCGFVGSMFH